MATTSHLEDIDDKFCLCSICLEQLKEPKQLPCLHRYCKDCLRSIIQGSHGVIKCPECREETQIPTNGVDGFKTDFYSKSLVEYVQIQQSLKTDEIRECYSCSKHLRVAAYCFKCNDFLCEDCHNVHVKNKTLKDHRKHTLSLEDVETKNITIERLASMRDAPRCHIHPEKVSELYCETCDNSPVCVACTYGEHKGHNLHEVKALAKQKRKELAQKLGNLEEMEKDKKPFTPETAKEKLMLNVKVEKEKVKKMHGEKDEEIMKKIEDIEGRIQQVKQEKQNTEKKLFDSLQKDMEHDIQEIKRNYEEMYKVKKIEVTETFSAQESFLENELDKLREKRERFHRDKKELLGSIEKQLTENSKIIETMSEHFDNVKRRFETLNVMASSILASENDWSAVQYIPYMCTAATNLMEDLKKDFPELTTLTEVIISYKEYFYVTPGITRISDEVQKKIHIDDPYHFVCGMTSSGDGNIVLSGYTSGRNKSFIVVIDINGRILKEKKFMSRVTNPMRYCKFLTQHKVASVCQPYEIGLFDIRDGSYIKKNIIEFIKGWPEGWFTSFVATDPDKKHILAGMRKSRDVYVFDNQLNYLHTLTLPEMIKWSQDISIRDSHLHVCDFEGKKYFVLNIDGSGSNLVGMFTNSNQEERDLGPMMVCTDKDGFVYTLWKNAFSYTALPHYYGQSFLVQYNQDSTQEIANRKLDNGVAAITVVKTAQGEKLAVATHDTQVVYFYDLITEG